MNDKVNMEAQDRAELDRLAVYLPIGRAVAMALAESKDAGKVAKGKRDSAFGAFKAGILAADKAGHDAKAYRDGMATACGIAGIPQGTVNGYITVATQLAFDFLEAGTLDAVTLESLSVAKARERYLSDDEKAVKAARKALADVTEDWTAESLRNLVAIAAEANLKAGQPAQTSKGDVIAA